MSRQHDGQTIRRSEPRPPTSPELRVWISGDCHHRIDPQLSARRQDGGHQQCHSESVSVSSLANRTNRPGWIVPLRLAVLVRCWYWLAWSLSSNCAAQKGTSAAIFCAVLARDKCFPTPPQRRRARACQCPAIRIQRQTGFHNGDGSRKS